MLNIYTNAGTTNIIVQNSLSKIDIQKLSQMIEDYNDIQLTFIDISFLSSELILKLDTFKEKIHISTNNKALWLYLKRLGIDIKLHHQIKNYKYVHKEVEAIAIGGSAGSLKSIVSIVEKIPFCDVCIFIVMHILPDQESKLVGIIKQITSLKVKEAQNGEKIEKGCIYIAPPDLHMLVENGKIVTSDSPKVNFCRPAIDVLFNSAAKEYKDKLITVLTCGYLDDGSRSLAEVKKYDGISLIQDPNQCEANDMPLNAMTTKNYDFVFDIEDIGDYLKSRLNLTLNLEERVVSLIKQIHIRYGYDFTNYDKNSLIRRVELLRGELDIEYFNDFESLVLSDHGIFQQLFEKLSINVSEFFRDIETFKQVKNQLLEKLKDISNIKIWCAGASKGQEAYSIAMMLDEYGLLDRSIIYATDFNALVLEQAKNGIFSKDEFLQCDKSFLQMGFENSSQNWFDIKENFVIIKQRIKNKVHFFQHNLVTDGEINEFQIVFCRNVLIYFNETLQNKVLSLLYDSLVPGGYLILGDSEHIIEEDKFIRLKNNSNSKIFKKVG